MALWCTLIGRLSSQRRLRHSLAHEDAQTRAFCKWSSAGATWIYGRGLNGTQSDQDECGKREGTEIGTCAGMERGRVNSSALLGDQGPWSWSC